jgi:hypothetical protein
MGLGSRADLVMFCPSSAYTNAGTLYGELFPPDQPCLRVRERIGTK